MGENYDDIKAKIDKIINLNNAIEKDNYEEDENNSDNENEFNVNCNNYESENEIFEAKKSRLSSKNDINFTNNNFEMNILSNENARIKSNDVDSNSLNELKDKSKNIEIIDTQRNNCLNNSFEICTFRDQILTNEKDAHKIEENSSINKIKNEEIKISNNKLSDYVKDELYKMTYNNLLLNSYYIQNNSFMNVNENEYFEMMLIELLDKINQIQEFIILRKNMKENENNHFQNLKNNHIKKIEKAVIEMKLLEKNFCSAENINNINNTNTFSKHKIEFINGFSILNYVPNDEINKLKINKKMNIKNTDNIDKVLVVTNEMNKTNESYTYNNFESLMTIIKNQEKIIEELILQNKLLETKIIKYKTLALTNS